MAHRNSQGPADSRKAKAGSAGPPGLVRQEHGAGESPAEGPTPGRGEEAGGRPDAEFIAAVRKGRTEDFEELVKRYSPRLFGMARRYARLEREAEDIVQEVWLKAYSKLDSYHGDAPFEHWLMRLAVRTCYDFLRRHQRNRESAFSELGEPEQDWLDKFAQQPASGEEDRQAAAALVGRLLERLSPSARLVIELLEIEDHSIKEIAELTGWSVPMVKVRAFRARAEMKRLVKRMAMEKWI